jgi:hypothetical protein
MHTQILMPPRWPQDVKLKINAALAACAPACVLSAEAVEELRLSTGLTAMQIKRCAENFRHRVKFEARTYTLEPPQIHDYTARVDADPHYVFDPLPHANKVYKTRFSNEVLSHLVNAIKRPENCYGRQFTDGCVLMLMHTTHLSDHSIRKWAKRYHRRNGKVCFAEPKVPRKERIRARKEAMKRAQSEDKAEDARIGDLRVAASAAAAAVGDVGLINFI